MYRAWFGPTEIEYPLVPLCSLSYDSETAHIPISLPESLHVTTSSLGIPSRYTYIPAEVKHSTALYVYIYSRYCILRVRYHVYSSTEKHNRHIKAQCWYVKNWGIIAFPTCSWRVESDPQQECLEAVRYSPRAVPTRLGRPARLSYRTTLAATSCYYSYTFLIEPRRMLLLLILLFPILGAKRRSLSYGHFHRFDPKVSITFLLGTSLLADL